MQTLQQSVIFTCHTYLTRKILNINLHHEIFYFKFEKPSIMVKNGFLLIYLLKTIMFL